MKLMQTPSQTVGPFFHYGLVDRGDENIMVTDRGLAQAASVR